MKKNAAAHDFFENWNIQLAMLINTKAIEIGMENFERTMYFIYYLKCNVYVYITFKINNSSKRSVPENVVELVCSEFLSHFQQ